MNPQQLRLAADIIEGGKEWEWKSSSQWNTPAEEFDLWWYVKRDYEIRLAPAKFPAPPAGKAWKEAGKFVPGDLESGQRPLLVGELFQSGDSVKLSTGYWLVCKTAADVTPCDGQLCKTSRPLPFPCAAGAAGCASGFGAKDKRQALVYRAARQR